MYLELPSGESWTFLYRFGGDEIVLQTKREDEGQAERRADGTYTPSVLLTSCPARHWPRWQRCPPAPYIPTLINCTKDLGAFWSALCHLLCSAPRYRWQCRMELAHPLAVITAPRCNHPCSLSQGRERGFLQIYLKSAGFLPSYLMTAQLSPPEFTTTLLSHHRQKRGGSSAKQLLLLREHAGAQNPLANLATMLQHGNSLHFKGTEQLIFLYVSRSEITSTKMPCLYWSLLLQMKARTLSACCWYL